MASKLVHFYQDELYKKSFDLPLLKCAIAWESARILQEIHEGIFGNHISERLYIKGTQSRVLLAELVSRCENLCEEK